MSMSFGSLGTSPAPPQADEAHYYALVSTSEEFAAQAADEYEAAPMKGTADYMALRAHTQEILDAINAWLGTHFSVPPSR